MLSNTFPKESASSDLVKHTNNLYANWLILLSVTAGCISILCAWVARDYLPTNYLWVDHADTLLIDQIAHNTLTGEPFFQHRFTQAGYFFPDILFAFFTNSALKAPFSAIPFHYLGAIVGLIGWGWLTYKSTQKAIPAIFSGLVYLTIYNLSLYTNPSQNETFIYFGLIGHHSSVGIVAPFVLMACNNISKSLSDKAPPLNAIKISALTISTVLLFLTVVSDQLFFIGIVIPFAIVLCAPCAWSLSRNIDRVVGAGYIVAIGVAANTCLHTLPFPQYVEFSQWVIFRFKTYFPSVTIDSFRAFYNYIFSSKLIFICVTTWLIASFSYATLFISDLVRQRTESDKRTTNDNPPAAQVFALGSVFILGSQLCIGLFSGAPSSRQFAGILISMLVASITLHFTKITSRTRAIWLALVGIVNFLLPLSLGGADKTIYQSKWTETSFKKCLAYVNENKLDFVADFWLKVPIERHSVSSRGVVASGLDGTFTNGQHVARIRAAKPSIAFANSQLPPEMFIRRFGHPAVTMNCGSNVTLMDYRGNLLFARQFEQVAAHAY